MYKDIDTGSGADRDNTSATGIPRRTMIKGAAWSIPVVAAAAALPTAAASGTIIITPGGNPVFVGACSEARNVTFKVTTNTNTNAPVAGAQVSVTLPAGWHWADNTTTPKVFVADANGLVTVTGSIAGSTTGSASMTGTVLPSGPSASVPVQVTGTIAREVATNTTPSPAHREMGGIPQGSTAIAWNVFLGPDGTLYTYHQDSGYSVVDTGVVSIDAQHFSVPNGMAADLVTYVKAGGTGKTWVSQGGGNLGGSVVLTNLPTGTTVVGWSSFLFPNGELWVGGKRIATNVTSAVVQHEINSAGTVLDYVTYVNGTGVHTGTMNGSGTLTPVGNYTAPTGDAKALGWSFSLRPNGDLYYQNQLIAQNVVSAEAQHTTRNAGESDLVTYVLADGTGVTRAYGVGAGTTTWTQNFGPNATVVGHRTFLTADGSLYYGDSLLDTQVTTADAWHERTTSPGTAEYDWIAWTRGAAC